MLKKILIATAVLAASSTIAFANGVPYVGASIDVQANTAKSGTASARVMPGSIFAGYGATVAPNVYLGGEIFGDVGSIVLNNNGLKSSYGIGASIIPGVMISEHTMAYARAGLVRTHFTSLGTNVNGGQLGLGMQADINHDWAVRTEYDYTAYRTTHNVTPRADEFKVGLVYKID